MSLYATFPTAWILLRVLDDAHVPVCLFRAVTGRPCPLCGLTHAFGYAASGRFLAALAANPLWLPAALVVVGVGLACLIDAARGTRLVARLAKLWWRCAWYVVAALLTAAFFL